MESYDYAMTKPGAYDDKPLPRRQPRGLLPSTWLGEGLTIEYRTGDGHSATMTGAVLLELFPFGPVVARNGVKTALSWDSITLVELDA